MRLNWDGMYRKDPNKESVDHIKEILALTAFTGICKLQPDYTYDIITFNKVLEHVYHPAEMVHHAFKYLKADGLYIEVPDAVNASKESLTEKNSFMSTFMF